MKSHIIYSAILALFFTASTSAEEPPGYIAETMESSETFRSRILKVHQVVEGDLEFAAYTVSWRGHEIVIPAPMGVDVLKEGDEIRCLMKSTPYKVGGRKRGMMSFSIISSRARADDEARLRAVAAEVNRRRAERAKADTKSEE